MHSEDKPESNIQALKRLQDKLVAMGVRNIGFTWAPGAENATTEERAADVLKMFEAIERGEFEEVQIDDAPSSLAKQEPRGAVPLTEEAIRQIEDDIRAGLPVGITRTITLCKMAVNGLLYGEEINRLRSAPLPSVVAKPILDKDGFPVIDMATWNAAVERCAKVCSEFPTVVVPFMRDAITERIRTLKGDASPAATKRSDLQECLDAIDAHNAKAMPDSPTPRTDTAVSCGYDDRNALVVMTKLSRQLERELAESERERKIAVKQCWDTETELTSSASWRKECRDCSPITGCPTPDLCAEERRRYREKYERFGTLLPLGERPKETDAEIHAGALRSPTPPTTAKRKRLEELYGLVRDGLGNTFPSIDDMSRDCLLGYLDELYAATPSARAHTTLPPDDMTNDPAPLG